MALTVYRFFFRMVLSKTAGRELLRHGVSQISTVRNWAHETSTIRFTRKKFYYLRG